MALTSTATHLQFAHQFREFIKGERSEPLRALRETAFAMFAEIGLPTPKLEDWKYTNVAAIGRHDWAVAPLSELSEMASSAGELLWGFDIKRNGFAALNVAFGEFKVITIPKGTKVDSPIELNFAAADATAVFPHILILAGSGSEATIVERYDSTAGGLTNSALQIVVEDNAKLTHFRVQKDAPDAFNIGSTDVTLMRDSRYDVTSINLGAAISRHDIDVKFTDQGGEAWVDGLYMLNGAQHSDTHSVIDHTVPNCTSHQTYKGVLNDRSRGVFNGKVFVRENASGTDAQQSNKNLLLSNDARVDTKPQLEIFNDDVKCSHGATVGQLEEEELFYLKTRGLPDSLSRNLLTYGFAEAVIDKISIESIKAELDAAVLNRLAVKL